MRLLAGQSLVGPDPYYTVILASGGHAEFQRSQTFIGDSLIASSSSVAHERVENRAHDRAPVGHQRYLRPRVLRHAVGEEGGEHISCAAGPVDPDDDRLLGIQDHILNAEF